VSIDSNLFLYLFKKLNNFLPKKVRQLIYFFLILFGGSGIRDGKKIQIRNIAGVPDKTFGTVPVPSFHNLDT
jgi:hypothetical protein